MATKTQPSPTVCAAMGPVSSHIKPFLNALMDAGYSSHTIQIKRGILNTFVKWLRHQPIPAQGLNEGHILAFVKCRPGKGKVRILRERNVLPAFLAFLRHGGAGVPVSPMAGATSPDDQLLQRYAKYLLSSESARGRRPDNPGASPSTAGTGRSRRGRPRSRTRASPPPS